MSWDPSGVGDPRSLTRVCDGLRNWLIEGVSGMSQLDVAVLKIAHELSVPEFDPHRISLAILPAQSTLDGLHYVWRSSQPESLEILKRGHGFLNQREHKQSPLFAVLATSAPVRVSSREEAGRFPFVAGLFDDGVTDYLALPLLTRRGTTHVVTATTLRPGGWASLVLEQLRTFAPALALVAESFEVQRLLEEKETLLREIHHRVKNNLQIVSSLLAMQAPRLQSEEAKGALQDSVHRVRSMALIHDQLYGLDSLATIDFGNYSRSLAATLQRSLAPHLDVRVEAPQLYIKMRDAVPLGLILNELLTNAFKHGTRPVALLPDSRQADGQWHVRVVLENDQGQLQLVVEDRGPGLSIDYEEASSTGLGLQLIHTLCRQVRGQVTAANHNRGGARVQVRCPMPA